MLKLIAIKEKWSSVTFSFNADQEVIMSAIKWTWDVSITNMARWFTTRRQRAIGKLRERIYYQS